MRIARGKIVLLFFLIFAAVVVFPQKTLAPSPGVAPSHKSLCDSGSPLPPPTPPCPPNPRVSS